MTRYFRLAEDGRTPIPVSGLYLENSIGTTVAFTGFEYPGNYNQTESKVQICTSFLAINHQYGNGPPILFETMIFGGTWDEYQDRYSTYEQAMKGHARAVRLVMHERIYARLAKIRECSIFAILDMPYYAAADCLRDNGEEAMADEVLSGGW